MRTVTEVIYDHLERRLAGDLEGDIKANFSEDVVLLSGFGRYRGHSGIRQSAAVLAEGIQGGAYAYNRAVIEGDYGFLEWTGDDGHNVITNGADSYHVVDGKIVFQSVHYTVLPEQPIETK